MAIQKICKGCGCDFPADRQSREFHSRSCFAQWRERQPGWQVAKRQGQLKGAATQRAKHLRLWAKRAASAATIGEAFREGRREGYRLGWKRGQRVGFSDGYEAALKDQELARTA